MLWKNMLLLSALNKGNGATDVRRSRRNHFAIVRQSKQSQVVQ